MIFEQEAEFFGDGILFLQQKHHSHRSFLLQTRYFIALLTTRYILTWLWFSWCFCFSPISSQRSHGAFCTRSSGTWEKLTDEWRPPLSSMLFSSQWSRVLCWRFGGGGLGGSFGETLRSCSFGINCFCVVGLVVSFPVLMRKTFFCRKPVFGWLSP